MKNIKNILILIAFIALAIFAYIQYNKPPREVKVIDKIYEYTTDTVYVDVFIPYKKDSADIVTPPREVIIYKTDTVTLFSDGVTEIFTYQPSTGYPDLVEFSSTKDEFHLTLLDTVGVLKTLKYPVIYDYYNYHYVNGEFLRKSTGYTPKDPIDWKALYVNTDYDFVSNTPSLFIDYQVDIKRIRFGAEARTTFTDVNPLGFRVKVGYRLFK